MVNLKQYKLSASKVLSKAKVGIQKTGQLNTKAKTFVAKVREQKIPENEKADRVYHAYRFYDSTWCEKIPARVQDEKKVARLLNAIHDIGFYKYYEQEFQGKKLLKEFVNTIAEEKGITMPEVEITFENINAGGYANIYNQIMLIGNDGDVINKGNAGYTVASLACVLSHECTHLYQFANMKESINGLNVEPKYLLMHFDNLMRFSEAETRRSTLLERINKELKNDDYIYNNDYFYNPMEIDARIESCEYLMNVLKNPYINNGVRQDVEFYLDKVVRNELHLKNVGSRARKILNKRVNDFSQEFDNTPYCRHLVSCYNLAYPLFDKYINDLQNYSETIDFRIDNALKQSQEIRNNQEQTK